jgi:crotonobetainyl-CoA:carnitine CoA-transferase CaiB-like acyl-CoA transferase
MGPLTDLRVLEIGDLGEAAGKLLADAGADVIRIEPPDGARSRRLGPFAHDRPGPAGSLRYAYLNTSKRGITLDPVSADGRALWQRLAERSDIVVDSSPETLDAAGGGAAAFSGRQRLIWCSITPFGRDGPWRDWLVTDLISMALGGPMASSGYDDHELPPIRPEGDHSLWVAGEYAVSGILAALLQRGQTGEGQQIDVSIHECVSATTEGAFPNWEYFGQISQRQTGRHAATVRTSPWQYRCRDGGYVNLMGGGIPRTRRSFQGLMAWMASEGAVEDLEDPRFEEAIFSGPRAGSPERQHMLDVIGRFVQRFTAEEVYRRGQALHLPWGIIRRPEDNLDDPHWQDRGFFVTAALPGSDELVRYPGAPYRFERTPAAMRHRAPLLGEHNHAVYGDELGLSIGQLIALSQTGVI